MVHSKSGEPFVLLVNLPTENRFSSYIADLYDPTGHIKWSVPISAETANDTRPHADPGPARCRHLHLGRSWSSARGRQPVGHRPTTLRVTVAVNGPNNRSPPQSKETSMSLRNRRIHYFHANATAVGGYIERPFRKDIPTQAPTSLSPSGGSDEASTTNFQFEKIITANATRSRVEGHTREACRLPGRCRRRGRERPRTWFASTNWWRIFPVSIPAKARMCPHRLRQDQHQWSAGRR